MRLLICATAILLVGCTDLYPKGLGTGDCVQRVHKDGYGEIKGYGKPIKVTRIGKFGVFAEYHTNIKVKFQEDGSTVYQSNIRNIYRSFEVLSNYRQVDCDTVYIEDVE